MNVCDLCQAKYRIFKVSDGYLFLSPLRMKELPGGTTLVPSGLRYRVESVLYGPVLARFLWRQRMGRSSLNPLVKGALGPWVLVTTCVAHLTGASRQLYDRHARV